MDHRLLLVHRVLLRVHVLCLIRLRQLLVFLAELFHLRLLHQVFWSSKYNHLQANVTLHREDPLE